VPIYKVIPLYLRTAWAYKR